MTVKQKRFCEEYLVDCNATQAAIRAGYSEKSARQIADRLLTNADIRYYIDDRLQQIQDRTIADAAEVMKYLTSVMRGESKSEIVIVEGSGDGCSEARHIQKNPDEKERLKAAELIGKRFGIFTDKVQTEVVLPVFGGESDLEE